MQVEYTARGEGWRGRGRPRAQVPPELLDILRRTYEQGVQANIPLYGAADVEVRRTIRLLENGAKQMGLRLQKSVDTQFLRFYLEDK